MKSTMSLQFSDLLVLSLAFFAVPATSSDVNKCILVKVSTQHQVAKKEFSIQRAG